MEERRYDRLVVWADREHSANVAFLTGFDPRFEEAVLVVSPSGDPALLVGNENYASAEAAPLPVRCVRFQDLSLPGQPRDASLPLPEILGSEGISTGSHVGVVGWKTYATRDTIEAPSFLVDELRRATGPTGLVENATDLFIDAADGLRVVNEVEQLAAFEWAACQTSNGVRNLITGLRPGMTEREAVRLLEWNGAPLSCHLMLTAGPRARFGLLSPGDRPIERGDPLTTAFGIWGALNCRAGFVVEESSELPDEIDRLRRAARRPVLHGRRRVVRGAARRPGGRRAAGDRRPPPRRPVLRHLPQPGPPAPPRRVGELTGVRRLDGRAAVRDDAPVRHHPGDRHAVLHDQHRGRTGVGGRVHSERRSPARTPKPGPASRPAGGS